MEDGQKIKDAWALERNRQFCRQSCTKIAQGLDALDSRSGERAIWELFQNARDLAKRNKNGEKEAHIKVTLTPDNFIFAHQGLAFTHDTLSSLVMQVSSESKEEDEDAVGQYGTGFLTTHVFGRRLFIDSSLDMEDCAPGKYVKINHFEINRRFDSIPEFVEKMAHQLVAVEDLAEAEMTNKCEQWTTLSYELVSANDAYGKAQAAIEEAVKLLPYVMTINKPLVDVEITSEKDGIHYRFSKTSMPDEDGAKVMGIRIEENGVSLQKKVFYLQSEDEQDTVILPLKNATEGESLDGIAKLFVFFPLLGTENFGMDFLFHSKRFYPVEKRDALHLPVENQNVKAKYEENVKVLNEMTDLVFNYLRQRANSIAHWENITRLCFDCERNKEEETNDFFRSFKNKWATFYQNLPIIEVNGEKKNVSSGEVKVLSDELVTSIEGQQAAYFDTVCTVCENFPLPSPDSVVKWSKVVSSWLENDHECFLTLNDVAAFISSHGFKKSELLHQFDLFIKDSGNTALFSDYALIPNRGNELKKKAELVDAKDIPDWLFDMTKGIIPQKSKAMVHTEFADIEQLTDFSRNDLKSAINDVLTNKRRETLDKINPEMYGKDTLKALANISSIFRVANGSTVRNKALPIIFKHLGIEYSEHILLPLSSEKRDITELPFKHLVENLFLEISMMDSECLENNLDYIVALHEALYSWNSYYDQNKKEGFAIKYSIFPNQQHNPCKASELQRGVDIPDRLAELYNSVFGTDIKEELVDERFTSFFEFKTLDAKTLAKRIEDYLAECKFDDDNVLDIINMLDDSKWQQWFPAINREKADLFMKQVKPECKEDVFRLMKIEDPNKLKQLADLAEDVDLDEIIRIGKDAVVAEHNRKEDFEFKNTLGKYVEEFIRLELNKKLQNKSSLIKVDVEDEQGGQDIIIFKDGTPRYYLEVKSRWGTDQSAMMSPLQMKQSVKETSRYALCYVDMTGFSKDCERHEYPPFEEVKSRIRSVTNIGSLIETVINSVTNDTGVERVHIGGDYKCIIPQTVIKDNAVSFEDMLQKIISILAAD